VRGEGRGCGDRVGREALGAEVGANSLVAAGVAEWHDLLPCLPGVGAALVPAVVQVGPVLVEDGGAALPLAVKEVLRGSGVGEEFDRAVGHAELALDRAAAVAGGQQSVDSGVVGPGSVGEPVARRPR
jgi:hypothetical protein